MKKMMIAGLDVVMAFTVVAWVVVVAADVARLTFI
jgi:hypothetical protein